MIKPVTSLADLEFKAKTDMRYQTLAILGYRALAYGSRVLTYKNAIKGLHEIAIQDQGITDTCRNVIHWVNNNINYLDDQPDPIPVVTAVKRKKKKTVVKVKKFKKAKATKRSRA